MSDRRLRVVETAQGVAAPACGRLFAGLGHDVVKCEPPSGDHLRRTPPLDEGGLSWTFRSLNAGKRSVAADPETGTDRALVDRLLGSADVLITDLDAAAPRESYPQLVVTSITPFGLDNEWSEQPGDSLLAEGYGGLATMIGEPDDRPLSLGGEQAAYAAAFAGFLGTMVALAARRRSGLGDLVDVAMCDVAAYIDWKADIALATGAAAPRRRGVRSGRWRMVPAADGWLGVIYQPDQWPTLRRLVGDPRLDDPRLDTEAGRDRLPDVWWPAVEAWARRQPARLAYARGQELGLPFGYVTTTADLAESPQYAARGFLPPKVAPGAPPVGSLVKSRRLEWHAGRAPELDADREDIVAEQATGERAGRTPQPAPGISVGRTRLPRGQGSLAGALVLDLGTITAGAAAGRLLADYGATVIKVESPSRPDAFRRWNPPGACSSLAADPHGTSAVFESNNVGKLSVALDLKVPRDRAAFVELARQADAVVENFRVGVTARLGVDFESLREVNEDIVYLSLSSHGQDGPESGKASFGSTLDLLSGLASVTGYDEHRLLWSSDQVNYPDQLVSLLGAGLVAYCLCQGVRGAHLDVAQAEVVSWTLADALGEYSNGGRIATPQGNCRPGRTPRDTYRTAEPDRWVALVCLSGEQRRSLADLAGIHAPTDAEDWWVAHRGEVNEAVTAWTSGRSRECCVKELHAAGVPAAPVLDAADRAADRRFTDRRVFLDEPVRLKGYPFRLESFRPVPSRRARRLGADTAAVLSAVGTGSAERSSEIAVSARR